MSLTESKSTMFRFPINETLLSMAAIAHNESGSDFIEISALLPTLRVLSFTLKITFFKFVD